MTSLYILLQCNRVNHALGFPSVIDEDADDFTPRIETQNLDLENQTHL